MRTVTCTSEKVGKEYSPLPLGNGDLSCFIDYSGGQTMPDGPGRHTRIWRAGRRYAFLKNRNMIPLGCFRDDFPSPPVSWRQTMDFTHAVVSCHTVYPEGTVDSRIFVHAESPVIVVEKHFSTSRHTFVYSFCGNDTESPPPFSRMKIVRSGEQVILKYSIANGSENGEIIFSCDKPFILQRKNNRLLLTVNNSPACFKIAYRDSMDRKETNAFSSDFNSHVQSWETFWKEGYVNLPGRIGEVYASAIYHLRCSATRWSIPAGGIDGHKWHGAYYGFDTLFAFTGLLSSGHFELAKRVPEFYMSTLPAAQKRAYTHWGKEKDAPFGADYPWLSDEKGAECADYGFWYQHVFHMAHIALTSWEYAQRSGDLDFLRSTVLPVMKSCSKYYETHSVLNCGNGRIIIGKCTDLERLGPGRENAFMTTCAVIQCFEKTAEACERLKDPSDTAPRLRMLAAALRESLPSKDGSYVPYPECEEYSIAVFSGLYPFKVLSPSEPLLKNALAKVSDKHSDRTGAMYPVGSECAWYLAWKSLAAMRSGNLPAADCYLDRLLKETQNFSEIYELSDPVMCPWFCTGEGTFLQALEERLLFSNSEIIRIHPYPAENYSFKMAAQNGVIVEFGQKNGKTIMLNITASHGFRGHVALPDEDTLYLNLRPGEKYSR